MNFIAIKDDNDNSFLINLDNIIAIAPYDGDKTKTSFHCTDCNRRVLPISFEKVEQVIDTLTNRNTRISHTLVTQLVQLLSTCVHSGSQGKSPILKSFF